MSTVHDRPGNRTAAAPPATPYEADVALRSGSTVRVRPIRPEDESRLAVFFRGLSASSRAFRFQAAVNEEFLDHAAARFSKADGISSFGLIATTGGEERIVAHAMYAVTSDDRAEVAFTVGEERREQGLGTLLLGELAQVASSRGVRVFEASILPENYRMLRVFRESGFPIRVQTATGELQVEFPTELDQEALEQFEQREWTAAVNAVRGFFSPRCIAVIGASRQRGTIGGEVLHNLLSCGLDGPVFPVNPKAPMVQNVVAYAGVEAIPGPVDLAVIVVPAEQVLEVAKACGRKGVRALVVISAGFAETGAQGRARQNELLRICRAAGIRLIGPNCLGILNTDPSARLNATFAPAPPPSGRLGFMSQSGALGLAIIDYASSLRLGLSTFASVGNKADISTNDLLRYWEQDPNTDAILLYLESFGNPRKFASLLANQPPPKGRRVAILTNAGGPGILCPDACVAEGLEVPPLTEPTRAALRALLPSEASVTNPVDMLASAPADQYREAIRVLGRDPNVDALIVMFVPPLVTRPDDTAQAIVEGARGLLREKPVLAVFLQSRGMPAELQAADLAIPSYAFPEDAALALAHVARYGEWLARPALPPPTFPDARRDEAAAVIAAALGRGAGWLVPEDVGRLLSCYGVPALETRMAGTPDEAAREAGALGGEVALSPSTALPARVCVTACSPI